MSIAKKLAAILTAGAIFALTATSAAAWDPDRFTYASNRVADVPVFNSMLWEPEETALNHDERQFVWIRECKAEDPHDLTQSGKGSGENPYDTESKNLETGKTYEVFIYYHNNASANFNDPDTGSSVMRGAKLKILLPETVKAGETEDIVGELSGDNMVVYAPDGKTVLGNKVQDNIKITSDQKLSLRYVPGSALIDNSYIKPTVTQNGVISVNPAAVLDDSFLIGVDANGNELRGDGALIGSEKLDGVVYGCSEYIGVVRFRFDAVKPEPAALAALPPWAIALICALAAGVVGFAAAFLTARKKQK